MSELQPGMLALVIGYTMFPMHLGKIVKVVSIEGEAAKVTGAEPQEYGLLKHLLPIKPEADPLDVTHKEELHA
jgi:hypothetical protein